MARISAFSQNLKNFPVLIAFLSAVTIIVLFCLAFDPIYQSNDDVVMSMIAHGYGLAAYGSPNLVFSNVLWGYVVRAIPTVNGVLGYSLATMATLLVFGWATLYFLLRLGVRYFLSLLTVVLLLVFSTLLPQFTINAGLLTVAAILGWQVYARLGGRSILLASCLLAFFGYLIRYEEFLLVLGVALPLLPWDALRKQRQLQIALLLLVVAIASAATFDHWSYSGSEWKDFKEFKQVRIPFTDYKAGEFLKQHPKILAQYGYSANDIDLLTNWAFVDPRITDPKALSAMLAKLGSLPDQAGGISTGWEGVNELFNSALLPLSLSALIFFAAAPHRSVGFAWMLFLVALFAMGVMGRPGILRVYVPLLSLLLVAPIVFAEWKSNTRYWIGILTLFTAFYAASTFLDIPQKQERIQQAKNDARRLPNPIVNWGYSFPHEVVFPVLSNDRNLRNIKIYGLDSFTLAPFSVAAAEQKAGRGMIQRLSTSEGLPIIAYDEDIDSLRIYCREHLNGWFRSAMTYRGSLLLVRQVWCEVNN